MIYSFVETPFPRQINDVKKETLSYENHITEQKDTKIKGKMYNQKFKQN